MAKNKETTASLFGQMPQLTKKELSSQIKPMEVKEEPKIEEPVKEVFKPVQAPEKKIEKTNKPQQKKQDVKKEVKEPVEEINVPLRKDGKIDRRFNENKQDKKYQMTMKQELFDEVNELAFNLSTPKNKVSVNSLLLEGLEDLLKKYKKQGK